MQILKDVASTRRFIQTQKQAGKTIGLVPTMGALHAGHLNLVSQCVAENNVAVASIFVNPIQFNNATDLAKYPRTLAADTALLKDAGCHAVFCPDAETMYQHKPIVSLDFGLLDKVLEGEFRPGHFSGVGVVVSKLFNILQPDVAYFGQKDFQQFLIIKQLVDDLNFPVKLICADIVREADGLAMSSRNQRLNHEARIQAASIYKMLQSSARQLGIKNFEVIKQEAEAELERQGIRLEYLALADRHTLKTLETFSPAAPSVLLVAVYVGDVRLIDNILV
jgi:pantoate--beta-alanine ligase